jgi:hypothetical protein
MVIAESSVCFTSPASLAGGALPLELPAREVQAVVADLLSSWQNGRALWERRRGHRQTLETTVRITPLDDADQPVGDALIVTTRDISPAGFSFIHGVPLAFRKVRAEFLRPDGQTETLPARLTWCRYRGLGRYESGGQFLSSP